MTRLNSYENFVVLMVMVINGFVCVLKVRLICLSWLNQYYFGGRNFCRYLFLRGFIFARFQASF